MQIVFAAPTKRRLRVLHFPTCLKSAERTARINVPGTTTNRSEQDQRLPDNVNIEYDPALASHDPARSRS